MAGRTRTIFGNAFKFYNNTIDVWKEDEHHGFVSHVQLIQLTEEVLQVKYLVVEVEWTQWRHPNRHFVDDSQETVATSNQVH